MKNANFLYAVNDRDEGVSPAEWWLHKKRTIILSGAIDEETAFYVSSAVEFLADRSQDDITLRINSPGGSVSDGLLILDVMQAFKGDIITVASGMAASMGAFLLAAGTKGKRYATPNAKILLHQPMGGAQGQASDIMIAAENIHKTKQQLTAHLSAFTGQSPEKINLDFDRDLWQSVEEALAYGIIDHIQRK